MSKVDFSTTDAGEKRTGFTFLLKNKDKYNAIGTQTSHCKAYLWDYIYWNFNNQGFGGYPITQKISKRNKAIVSLCPFSERDIPQVKARLKKIDQLLGFPKTVVKYDNDNKCLIVEGCNKWMADVTIFCLFLSTIRFGNSADKAAFGHAVSHIGLVKEYFSKIQNAPYWPKEDMRCSHGLGYCRAFGIVYTEDVIRYVAKAEEIMKILQVKQK